MDYADMLIEVTPGMNGIPDFVATKRVREAVIEFCEKTWIYKDDLTITTEPDETEYTLTAPANTVIQAVLSVQDDDEYLLNFTVESDFSSITLTNTPSEAFDMTIKVALAPDEDSTSFPDFIWARHRRPLVAGGKAYCFGMENRPWTSHDEEARNLVRFKNGLTRAKMSMMESRVGVSRVEMRNWT